MEKSPSRREQIDSHSSLLTNRLIVEQASTKVWACEILAWENPLYIEPAIRYWSAVQALYTQCSFFFSQDTLEEYRPQVEDRLKKGMLLLLHIQMNKSYNSAELVWQAWMMHMLIRQAGQVLGYWVRMSRINPKGMKEHIEMFDRINPLEVIKNVKNAGVRKVDKDAAAAAN